MGVELIPIFVYMKTSLLYIVCACFLLLSCKQEPEKSLITVNGPIPVNEMGTTLVHEHVLVDFIGADSTGYHRWNKQEVVERILPFLEEIRDLGVNTLIECTPAYLGRDPVLLKMLADKTGMNFITNTGYYGAHNNRFLPVSFYDMTAEELAKVWIGEFENGIEESGIMPGFIKIAVDANDSLSAEHRKIISAAALTHKETGLVIASHTGPDQPAFEQIDILKSYGIDPSAFIWVHAQRGTLEGIIRAARSGSWVSLDNINAQRDLDPQERYSIVWYADRISSMREEGLLQKVLNSHDAGWYSPGEEGGGNFRGYTDLFTHLIQVLKERGFSSGDIEQLLSQNPREAYGIDDINLKASW